MEYKHFSHAHGLVLHQVPQESEIICSGCNFPGTGSVYVCWQCRFFLHEYCFNASRSIIHPSHPSHPLNLFPYPTYPSNSFYCNSCNLVGTGFSYGCSNCEFDLHVHCTYNPVTNILEPPLSVPKETPGFDAQQHAYMPQTAVYHDPIHTPNIHEPSPYYPNLSHPVPNKMPSSEHVQMKNETNPRFSTPEGYPSPEELSSNTGTNPKKTRGTKHFSHSHPLHLSKVAEEDYITCSGCEQDISGLSYSCTNSDCNFYLHKTCFELRQEIRHKSHPDHPLTLLSSPPYKEYNEFTCNACFEIGTAFTYHCSTCKFDLHVTCASLPETVKRKDHEHALVLLYTSPITEQMRQEHPDISLGCDICKRGVEEGCWVYNCKLCNYGTHLGCVNSEEISEEVALADAVFNAQASMQRLQIQLQMSQQSAQFAISCAQSLSNLAG